MDRLHKLWIWARTAEALVRVPLALCFSLKSHRVLMQFTFKYVILTIALWLPAVVKSSACTTYLRPTMIVLTGDRCFLDRFLLCTERRLVMPYSRALIGPVHLHFSLDRALIMAQTTLNIYAADQIFK